MPQKEFCSILGHSGCGRTTLLNMSTKPSDAELLIDGGPVATRGGNAR